MTADTDFTPIDFADALATITRIEHGPNPVNTFTPGRYPFTYAYDYVRSHAGAFGITAPGLLSRAEVSKYIVRDTDDPAHRVRTCIVLAHAYMREHHIKAPYDQTTAALRAHADRGVTDVIAYLSDVVKDYQP